MNWEGVEEGIELLQFTADYDVEASDYINARNFLVSWNIINWILKDPVPWSYLVC
jgi:hypothetical protein